MSNILFGGAVENQRTWVKKNRTGPDPVPQLVLRERSRGVHPRGLPDLMQATINSYLLRFLILSQCRSLEDTIGLPVRDDVPPMRVNPGVSCGRTLPMKPPYMGLNTQLQKADSSLESKSIVIQLLWLLPILLNAVLGSVLILHDCKYLDSYHIISN